MKKEIIYEDYDKIQICTGTILEASINEKAKKPAYVLKIDFGDKIGIKTSSAQITTYYKTNVYSTNKSWQFVTFLHAILLE